MFINSYFPTVIWSEEKPEYLKSLNKASNKYISDARKRSKDHIKKWGDFGMSYHSTPLTADNDFLDFRNYIGQKSWEYLDHQGYDMQQYTTIFSEMWVQEFAKKGGGHHTLHTHWNGHISGFYFLKASEKTSLPLFEDPRPGNLMNGLPEKDKSQITYASTQINYKVEPGSMIFFPSYIPHQYIVDMGYDPFRFIHWNCQAIPKGVLNV